METLEKKELLSYKDFTPLNNNLLVRKPEAVTQTKSGIHIPETVQDKATKDREVYLEVLATPNEFTIEQQQSIKIGDFILPSMNIPNLRVIDFEECKAVLVEYFYIEGVITKEAMNAGV